MASIIPYLQGGWADSYDYSEGIPAEVACYTHQGYVYLVGEITNQPRGAEGTHKEGLTTISNMETPYFPWPAVDQTIMTGLPSALCPPHSVSVILPINPLRTTDPATPALNMPVNFATTMHPDGSWTFDNPLPNYVNEPPPAASYYFVAPGEGNLPQYPNPLVLTLVIGNARWPVAGGADTYKTKTLVPFLAGQFTSSDAAYAVHGSRVHLAGHATADAEGAHILLRGPSDAYEEMEESFIAGFIGEPTTAVGPDGVVPLFVEAGFGNRKAELLTDEPVHKRSDSPPLSVASPATGRGYYDHSGGRANRNLLTSAVDEPERPKNGGQYQGRGPVVCAGQGFECRYKIPHNPVLVTYCLGPAKLPSLTFDVPSLLGGIFPQPAWFTLDLKLEATSPGSEVTFIKPFGPLDLKALEETFFRGIHGSTFCEEFVFFPAQVGCGYDVEVSPWFTVAGAWLPPGEPGGSINYRQEHSGGEPPQPVEGPSWPASEFVRGSLFPTDGSKYKGVAFPEETILPYIQQLAPRLWTPAQAGTIAVDFIGEMGFGGSRGELSIQPYYEMRQFGIHRGDSLDLTLTGWRSSAGQVEIGPETKAIIPRAG